jgi:hypothetical protein
MPMYPEALASFSALCRHQRAQQFRRIAFWLRLAPVCEEPACFLLRVAAMSDGWSGALSASSHDDGEEDVVRDRSRSPRSRSSPRPLSPESDEERALARIVQDPPSMPDGFDDVQWWARPIFTALEHIRRARPKHQSRPIVLHSACTGTFAEKLACDALGLVVGECVGADLKPASRRFVESNVSGVIHFFQSLQELTQSRGHCLMHGSDCTLRAASDGGRRPDFAIFGPPCQPFTRQRARSGTTVRTGCSEAHPQYDVTMRGIVSYIAAHRPLVSIIEQVPAFAAMDGNGTVPIESFLRDLQPYVAAVRVVELEQETWVNVCRTRPAMHSNFHRQNIARCHNSFEVTSTVTQKGHVWPKVGSAICWGASGRCRRKLRLACSHETRCCVE